MDAKLWSTQNIEYLISLKVHDIYYREKTNLGYKSFPLHPIWTKIAYMNRYRNTESNGVIFIL